MKLISWNTGGRRLRLADQIRAVTRQEADLVCLQEIRESTSAAWREALAASGLIEIADSGDYSNRKLFNLTASRWPVEIEDPLDLPQPERLLTVVVRSDRGAVELHNLHVPPTRDRAGTRPRTLLAVYEHLARNTPGHRILCGDLNTARAEFAEPDPAAQGEVARAESLVLKGLAEWDLHDVFRELHGFGRVAVTRSGPGHHRQSGHRLDHVLASRGLNPVFCEYQDGWRQEGYSDHSAMEVIFDPDRAP